MSEQVGPTQTEEKSSRVESFIANPRRAVWKLSVPVMLGMGLHTLYAVTDMIFVGRLGGDEVAALSFSMPLVFFSIGITFGLGTGATSVIARLLGAGLKKDADNAAKHAVLIALAIGGVVIAAALLWKREIMGLLGTSGEVTGLAVQYFEIVAPGFFFTILNTTFRAIMAGEGNTITPISFQASGTVINVLLDPLFIFWAGLGISGAAWATVVSQFLVLLLFAVHIFVRRGTFLDFRFDDFNPCARTAWDILRVGLPASGSMVIISVGAMCTNWIVSVFGNAAVAGLGVGGRLDSIYFMPTFALASSQVTLAGMFLGAGRIDLIRKTMVYTMLWGQVLAVSFAFVFYFFATPLCAIFTSDQQIIAVAVSYIRVIALAFPFITVGLISGRVFQGLGSGLPGLVLSALRVMVISVPLAYLFTRVLGFGLTWVWGASATAGLITSLVATVWIQRRLRQLEEARTTE